MCRSASCWPSDGGAASDAAAELCGQIAKVSGVPVTIVSAIANERSARAGRRRRAQGRADAPRRRGLRQPRRPGRPADAIIEAARELGADLVVVGHHRGKGLQRVIAAASPIA